MTRTIRAGMAALLLGFLPVSAPAQAIVPQCGNADQIVERLTEGYDERPVSGGQSSTGIPLQVWVSGDRSTWTITFAPSEDIICLVMAGEDWEDFGARPEADAPGGAVIPDL